MQDLVGNRLGPYNSFNPVSRTQIWQWCSAMGDHSPLYLEASYRARTEFTSVVAPPAMMQMWTMRDVNMSYAPGSTSEHPYQVMHELEERGFPGNVAVSYDISFHRYLVEGDRAHHYTTVVNISELKETALGRGHFFTERVEYRDQNEALFAEALITYFQYQPVSSPPETDIRSRDQQPETAEAQSALPGWQSKHSELEFEQLAMGQALPQLVIPITHRLIVAGAIATQDFIPVHHNVDAAKAAGLPDIIMNILTTCGLSARYLSDWAGPASRLRKLSFRLMTPNTPGDSMRLQGKVTGLDSSVEENGVRENRVNVDFTGSNSRGPHVLGTAELALIDPATAIKRDSNV